MEYQRYLDLLNIQTILNLWQENGTLPMIIQKWIIIQEMKLPIMQKF